MWISLLLFSPCYNPFLCLLADRSFKRVVILLSFQSSEESVRLDLNFSIIRDPFVICPYLICIVLLTAFLTHYRSLPDEFFGIYPSLVHTDTHTQTLLLSLSLFPPLLSLSLLLLHFSCCCQIGLVKCYFTTLYCGLLNAVSSTHITYHIQWKLSSNWSLFPKL